MVKQLINHRVILCLKIPLALWHQAMARLLKCLPGIFSFKLRSQKNVRVKGLNAAINN